MTGTLAGRIHEPGTPGFDEACAGFDLAAIPRPDVAVTAVDESDVVAAVRFAADEGMPVAVRATGHGPIAGVDHGVLVNTGSMSDVRVDPDRRSATIGAGATWADVLTACTPLGLAPLCGSAPGVGAVSYSLGGGLGPLGRHYGFAADHVRRLRLVTSSGEPREVTADTEPELFWATRGGGGNFGIVTELEIDLEPVRSLYGGGLYFPGDAAPDVLESFGRTIAGAPDDLTLSIAFITFPEVPAVPAELRGRFVAHLRVAHLGQPAEAESLLAPLRRVATPIVDTVRTMPVAEIGTIHADPDRPQPVSCTSAVLPGWDDAAIEILADDIGATTPHMLELRHLGGALARPPAVANAVGHRDAALNLFTSAYPGPGFADSVTRQAELEKRLVPWTRRRSLFTFTNGSTGDGSPTDARVAFDEPTFTRLQAVKTAVDPQNMFRFTVNIPPGERSS